MKEHPFTDEELDTIFETARFALYDPDIFGTLADALDVADEYLAALERKLDAFMRVETKEEG